MRRRVIAPLRAAACEGEPDKSYGFLPTQHPALREFGGCLHRRFRCMLCAAHSPREPQPCSNRAIAIILSSETRTRLKTAALVTGIVAAVLTGLVTLLEHRLEGLVIRFVAARGGGRPIRVNGDFEAHWLTRHPRITAGSVVVGNPPWMPAGITAEIGRVSVVMRWQLSALPLRLQRLEFQQAQLHLLRSENGRANWYASADGAGNGPPLIESLAMPDASVDLRDDRWHLLFHGRVSAGDAVPEGTRPPPLHIEANGELNGRAASVTIEADPLALARRDRPYHFSFLERSGAARLSGEGSLAQAFDFRVLNASFTASGPGLKQLRFLVGLSWPDTGPFHGSATLHRKNDRFQYDDLVLTCGGSELRGNLVVDSSQPRSVVEGALRAKRLRLADLGPHTGSPETGATPDSEPRLADVPLRTPLLLRTDGSVTLRIDELEFGADSLQALSATLKAQQGVLSLDGLSATLAQGKLTAAARLDTSATVPRGQLNVTVEALQVDELLRAAPPAPAPVSGALSGRVRLSGSGKTLRQLGAATNGTVAAIMPNGTVQDALVQSASLELGGLLGRLRHSRKQTDIRCAVATLDVHEGIGTLRTLVIDTDDALLTGDGTVNLASDSLDLSVRGRPKKPSLALHAALHLQGSLAHPRVSVTGGGGAGQTAAAVALGVLLTPVASVLAFVNPGLAHNADCAALTAQAAPAPAADGNRP
jgi:AsmA family protein